MDTENWKSNYTQMDCLRTQIKDKYNIPKKVEIKAKEMFLNKYPMKNYNLGIKERHEIVDLYIETMAKMEISIINVVINKKNIRDEYDVLGNALKYNIQRIENDLKAKGKDEKFMIITDQGRLEKMRHTARKMQRHNPIPSKISTGHYLKNIEQLIEDPLAKDSKESHFIQLADLIAFFIYHFFMNKYLGKPPAGRLTDVVKIDDIKNWLSRLESYGKINMKASKEEYGIVNYPK